MASGDKNNYDENNNEMVNTSDLSEVSMELPGTNIIWCSDGIVGPVNDWDATSVIKKGANLEELIATLKEQDLTKKVVILSGGNNDITKKGYGIDPSFSIGKEEYIITHMVSNITKHIWNLSRYLRRKQSLLIVCGLIPRPSESDPKECAYPENIQKIISEAFVRANNEIHQLNDSQNLKTPNLKHYVEVKTKKGKGKEFYNYEGREQKRICVSKFENDKVNIKKPTLEKMKEHIFECNKKHVENFLENI